MPGTEDNSTDDAGTEGLSSPQAFEAGDDELPPIAAGDCFGRYTVREPIGAGAMGEVYAAHDPELDRLVALKVLRMRESDTSPRARARFQREAQAMARLNHPNVVAVHDVGTVGDRVFVAMELVHGPTLASWIAERPHPWREVVALFLEAGRGLAAAHAAGIIHRDFKPANVIVGDRIRVADFGLARAVSTDEPSSGPSEAMLQGTVTHTGQLIGTPAYMAPEVRAGAPPTPQSDQYAYAVALYEALFDARPGEPATSRPVPPVPGWLRAIVERGLRSKPSQRYPSMTALLADLGRDRSRAWRRAWAAAALAVLAVGGVSTFRHWGAPVEARCAAAGAMPAFWNDTARAQVAQAFRATGKPFADGVFDEIDAALRARSIAWARGSREACEATEVRHELSEGMLDLRRRCLARAKAELEALIAILGRADAKVLTRAAQAVGEVGDVDACADDDALAAAAPMPKDPAIAHEVAALEQDLARLVSLGQVGRWEEGVELGRNLSQRARRVGYGPVLARALAETGRFEVNANRSFDEAIGLLYEATSVGAAAKDDVTVAAAFADLVFALGSRKQRFEAADVAYQSAVAAAARAGNPARLLAKLYSLRGNVLSREGHESTALALRLVSLAVSARIHGASAFADRLAAVASSMTTLGQARAAWPLFDRAIAIAEEALGPAHPSVARFLANAGSAHLEGGDVDGAARLLERALAVKEQAFSPDHLEVAETAINLARVRLEQRRLTESRALYERSARIREAQLGPDHPDVARSRHRVASVIAWEGRPEEAHDLYQRARAVYQKAYGAEPHPWVAELNVDDAVALLDLGRLPEARAAAEQGRAIYEKTLGADHPDTGDALATLGMVLCAEGRRGEAAPLYRRAIALHEREVGPESPVLVEPLIGLCDALVSSDLAAAREAGTRAATLAGSAPADLRARAEFCLAQAENDGARARRARDALLAVPHRRHDLARMDAWLARMAP